MYNDTSVVSDECGSIRQLTGSVESNVGNIDNNFSVISAQLEEIKTFLNSFYSNGKFDFDGKCLTNLGSCCDDPTSALSRQDIDDRVPQVVNSALSNAITRVKEHAMAFGSSSSGDFLLPVIDTPCDDGVANEVVNVVYALPNNDNLPVAVVPCATNQ